MISIRSLAALILCITFLAVAIVPIQAMIAFGDGSTNSGNLTRVCFDANNAAQENDGINLMTFWKYLEVLFFCKCEMNQEFYSLTRKFETMNVSDFFAILLSVVVAESIAIGALLYALFLRNQKSSQKN